MLEKTVTVHESGATIKTKCHKVAVVSLGEAGQHHCDFTKGGHCLSLSTHGGYSSQLLENGGGAGSGSTG